jgi:hypothetical protein
MRFLLPAALLAAALASGCASRPDIHRDRDPAADLAAYKTFAFYPAMGASSRYAAMLGERVKDATRRQLAAHYAYSEIDPDLRVNVAMAVADRQELRSTPGARGYRTWGSVQTGEYKKGMLRIEIVDARRNALVWQGVAEGRVDDTALDDPGTAIDETVRALFAGFPQTNAR